MVIWSRMMPAEVERPRLSHRIVALLFTSVFFLLQRMARPPAGACVLLFRRAADGSLRSAEQVEVLGYQRRGAHYSLAPGYQPAEEIFEVRGIRGDSSEMRLLHLEDELASGEDGQARGHGRGADILNWQRVSTPAGAPDQPAAAAPTAASVGADSSNHRSDQRKSLEQMLRVHRYHFKCISNTLAELSTELVKSLCFPLPLSLEHQPSTYRVPSRRPRPPLHISRALQAAEARVTERLEELVRATSREEWGEHLDKQVRAGV